MARAEERLMQWLRDAHAMEEQAETMLAGQAGRIKNYPKLKARIERHLEETRSQAERVRGCIERRNGSTSALKDAAAKVVAMGQAASGLFVGDEVVKGSLASYTFEHMEIASYKILIAAARAVGDTETAKVCRGILSEEEAMADWLMKNIGPLTKQYLGREENPRATAKR